MKTVYLSNDLAVMNKLAEANTVIDRFINSCSHSMRGPLKTIRGLVNLIGDEEKNAAPMLELIVQAANKMENTLDQLEQFLENSKKEVKIQEVNVADLLDELKEKFQPLTETHHIEVMTEVEGGEYLFTDEIRLKTILQHVISNAITFHDPGKEQRMILIQVKISHSSFEVSVKDNGIGIDPLSVPKIFQLFYRGTEKSRGAGIGLYVVKEIVEKMKGLVSVQSRPESGSNFTFWLPNLI